MTVAPASRSSRARLKGWQGAAALTAVKVFYNGIMQNRSHHDLFSRRDYLKQLAAASAAAWIAGERRLISAAEGGEKIEHPKPTADACIVLWMAGGMAAPENFDPNKYVPFEVG